MNNGERFDTYAIRGPRGSGVICLNGPAARLAHVGDLVIILTYAWMERDELERHTPRVVMVDERNRPLRTVAAALSPARSVRKPRRLAAVKLRIAGALILALAAFFPAIASTQESRPGVPGRARRRRRPERPHPASPSPRSTS